MAYIGEITIRLEFPETYSEIDAQFSLKGHIKAYEGIYKNSMIKIHVSESRVYNEEDMRKEMEGDPIHRHFGISRGTDNPPLCDRPGKQLYECASCILDPEKCKASPTYGGENKMEKPKGVEPCFSCAFVDDPQEEEPCFACLVNEDGFPHFVRCK